MLVEQLRLFQEAVLCDDAPGISEQSCAWDALAALRDHAKNTNRLSGDLPGLTIGTQVLGIDMTVTEVICERCSGGCTVVHDDCNIIDLLKDKSSPSIDETCNKKP